MQNTIKSIALHSTKDGADKIYTVQIDEVEGGYLVIYANGRRGASLKPSRKTPMPVALDVADGIFNKLVKEKTNPRKGYTVVGEDGGCVSVVHTSPESKSGIEVQLLTAISRAQAEVLCLDPAFVAQEKHDGERRPIQIAGGGVKGINRNGLYVGLTSKVVGGIPTDTDMVFDAEGFDSHVVAFDILEHNGKDLRSLGFMERHKALVDAVNKFPSVRISPVAVTSKEKLALLARIESEKGEGIVFKRAEAAYEPGKGDSQLKFKLYDETSAIVIKINNKRSVEVGVLDESGSVVSVGNVTIPANAEIPTAGDIIEVRYLYAYAGGSLYQPTFLKPRSDLTENDCLLSRLKLKPSSEVAA